MSKFEACSAFNTIDTLTIVKLKFAGAIEFGSVALDVHTNESDTDLAILKSNFNTLLSSEDLMLFDIKDYFRVIPSSGQNYIIPNMILNYGNEIVDLLVIEHKKDITAIKNAVKYVKATYSKRILANKIVRIALYEDALLQNGFIETTEELKWK